ncbi:MAG TPA: efflux RND transporter periplasmic adaptor subunit [Kiritimatiellia bacterium]|nr:efflux RND transporter periplasmic adaptor subunit [Kiritimatiellia bacterium]
MNASDIPKTDAEKKHPKIWLSLKIILPLVVLAIGVLILFIMIETAPTAGRQPPPRNARLVETTTLAKANIPANINAMGRVHPAREVVLQPQVSGQVLEISDRLIPGGVKNAGDLLVVIDPVDFQIAIRQAESELAMAHSEYVQEMGQQAVARNEYALLGGDSISPEERALILREPQLARAKARLDNAQAALERATLNLQRTQVRAPFNAVIRARHVDTGAQVTPATPLVTLTDSDVFWITAPVPVSQLAWIEIPEGPESKGSMVNIRANGEDVRQGRVLRRLTHLEEDGRMAQLLIEVEDPLNRRAENQGLTPLLAGDFVRLEIVGRTVADVLPLDRRWLRARDSVWILNQQDELEIRPVEILFRGERYVLVSGGLDEGERIVLTDISTPVSGMKLRTGAGSAR